MRRRQQPTRILEPKKADLPPMGWVVTDPFDPPANCSWCGRDLVDYRGGVTCCPECDCLPPGQVIRA